MARQANVSAENNFVRGLITETTALKFPENACTETFNCVFDETGRVTRRLGIDIETDGGGTLGAILTDAAYTEFKWDAVAGDGNRSIFVQQRGSDLYFYDISTTGVVGKTALATIDLTDFEPGGALLTTSEIPCQYSTGNGDLIVTSEAIDIIYIVFDENDLSITANPIGIFVRDFQGLEDGFTLNERPASDVATLKLNEPRHYYNLLNQGWHATDALTQWDTARADLPSNADYVALYRSSDTDAFDNTLITSQGPGNRTAPKGHFLLVPYAVDRTAAMVNDGFTGADVDPATSEYNLFAYTFTNISPVTPSVTNYGAIKDTVTNQNAAACAARSTTGVEMMCAYDFLTSGTALRITKATVHGSNDLGYIGSSNPSTIIELYAKQGFAPTSTTDGTLLGSITFNDTSNESVGRDITSSDPDTPWHHAWIRVRLASGGVESYFVAEVRLFGVAQDPSNSSTYRRPRCNEFFAGRVWYAGVDALGLNSSIFFSQIAAQRDQYNKCYQVNDPTSEEFSDLLPDDGGVIKIPEIGSIHRLYAYQASLIVMASNGIWLISGTAGSFAANDYTIRKISSQGTRSPQSVVNVNGVPVWWGDDGIFTVTYSAEFDSFTVVSLSEQTIRSFYLDIPEANRPWAKGAYDAANNIIYWLYNDTEDATAYTYNSVLVFNTISKSFYPWTISDLEDLNVRGIAYVHDASRSTEGKIKYTTTVDQASDVAMFWSEFFDTEYVDWGVIAPGYSLDVVDYESYFITGYKIHGDGQRYFQSNYVFVYLDTEDQASCRVQGIWEFTNSGNSGRWSSLQQIYNPNLLYRDVNYRRLKIRGKGRSLQLRFESETGRPFSIIGWSIAESSNAGL